MIARPRASLLSRPRRLAPALVVVCGLALLGGAAAPDTLPEAVAGVEAAVRDYQDALTRLLALQDREAGRAADTARRYRTLHHDGLVSRLDAEVAERAATAASAKAQETRDRIAEGDRLALEARAMLRLAALPPAAPGAERSTPWVVEYRGVTPWTLARAGGLERFFAARFGRPLPVSALGQTALHDRLGFAHHDALDIAVHPDSPEGKALLEHLRAQGVPFLAFREARAGASTGAHVHVGPPSPRRS
jgi:hypothetical protein